MWRNYVRNEASRARTAARAERRRKERQPDPEEDQAGTEYSYYSYSECEDASELEPDFAKEKAPAKADSEAARPATVPHKPATALQKDGGHISKPEPRSEKKQAPPKIVSKPAKQTAELAKPATVLQKPAKIAQAVRNLEQQGLQKLAAEVAGNAGASPAEDSEDSYSYYYSESEAERDDAVKQGLFKQLNLRPDVAAAVSTALAASSAVPPIDPEGQLMSAEDKAERRRIASQSKKAATAGKRRPDADSEQEAQEEKEARKLKRSKRFGPKDFERFEQAEAAQQLALQKKLANGDRKRGEPKEAEQSVLKKQPAKRKRKHGEPKEAERPTPQKQPAARKLLPPSAYQVFMKEKMQDVHFHAGKITRSGSQRRRRPGT